MKIPKVSVVLTTYNRARVLDQTVQSILSQSYEDFELVVRDDASQDETEGICRDFERQDHRVRYRRGLKNVGMPGNLNAGIEACSAEYVANLHDGDLYEPTLSGEAREQARGSPMPQQYTDCSHAYHLEELVCRPLHVQRMAGHSDG